MRILSIILTILFFSCGKLSQEEKKSPEVKEVKNIQNNNPISVGNKISGDFNGDGVIEIASELQTKKGQGNPVEDGTADEFAIHFSTEKLKSIDVGCCEFKLINEGDLNNDGSEELSIFQAPMNGCTYSITTYAIRNGNWKQLIETFIVPTACENFSDKDLQNRIFKEGGTVYFYETDLNDENFKLIKTKAILNE